jgi:predicted enzyme related to lactoylglutathione lyase
VNLFQVNLFVSDFRTMLAFYTHALGFAINEVDPGPPCVRGVNWASVLSGSVIIELFDVAAFGDPAPQSINREAAQLCFIVDNVAEQWNRLTDNGVDLDPIETHDWGRCAAFRDPEGNRLQIFEVTDHTAAPERARDE